jgi:hypothetical protein
MYISIISKPFSFVFAREALRHFVTKPEQTSPAVLKRHRKTLMLKTSSYGMTCMTLMV